MSGIRVQFRIVDWQSLSVWAIGGGFAGCCLMRIFRVLFRGTWSQPGITLKTVLIDVVFSAVLVKLTAAMSLDSLKPVAAVLFGHLFSDVLDFIAARRARTHP